MTNKIAFFALVAGLMLGQTSITMSASAQQGKQTKTHSVASGETLTSISRKYGCTITELKAANPGVGDALSLKQVLKVPAKGGATAVAAAKPEAAKPTAAKPAADKPAATASASGKHSVKSGESLFSIARKYNTSVAAIKEANKLKSDALSLGQNLSIPGQAVAAKPAAPKPAPAPTPKPAPREETTAPAESGRTEVAAQPRETQRETARETTRTATRPSVETASTTNETVAVPTSSEPVAATPSSARESITSPAFTMVREEVAATTAHEGELSPERKYALHRSAPVGTIVKLKNRANNKIVFVKVVGKISPASTDEEMHISQSAAEQLGLTGQTAYRVESSYGVSNN